MTMPWCKQAEIIEALTAQNAELVERLRAWKAQYRADGDEGTIPLASEAADHIEALEARVAELEGALERQSRNFDLLLAGKPVRDVDEMRAETRTALQEKNEVTLPPPPSE